MTQLESSTRKMALWPVIGEIMVFASITAIIVHQSVLWLQYAMHKIVRQRNMHENYSLQQRGIRK